jgi:hypothetical protein
MFGKKSQLDVLLDAYKIGGLPFTLLVMGGALLLGGIVDNVTDLVTIAQPTALLASAIALVAMGVVTWIVQQIMINRVQLALLGVIEELARGAARTAKTGGDYQSAIRGITDNMESLLVPLLKTRDTSDKTVP